MLGTILFVQLLKNLIIKLNFEFMLYVRRGLSQEVQDFVNLFLISAPYFPKVFGEVIVDVLKKSFQEPGNLLSYEHTYFAEVSGEIAGMLLGYDWRVKSKENLKTGFLLLKLSGLKMFLMLDTYLKFNNTVGRLDKFEYYISNIATYEKFRGKGVGKALMSIAEKEAKRSGCMRVVLDVERENVKAIAFYKSLGFEEKERFDISINKGGVLSFTRMVKLL